MSLKVLWVALLLFSLCAGAGASASASDSKERGAPMIKFTRLELPRAKFATGDDPARRDPAFDDSGWVELSTLANYEKQGFDGYDGWSWYRFHVRIPSSLKDTVHWQQRLRIYLSSVDDVDESFFNGVKIGQTGRLPSDPGGYDTQWQALREYFVDLKSGLVRWDQDNVIAVRVYDGGGGGGFFRDMPYINMAEIVDGVHLNASHTVYRFAPGQVHIHAQFDNSFFVAVTGQFAYELYDTAAARMLREHRQVINISANGNAHIDLDTPQRAGIELRYRLTESSSGKALAATLVVPYLLTPPEPPQPRLNGAVVVGARPNTPFLFQVAATGRAPLRFSAQDLPAGLLLEERSGLITGSVAKLGNYSVKLRVSNDLGAADRVLTIRIGEELALTPPMGWNSWNGYGLDVNDAKLRATADAMLAQGLTAHGWSYVNIDDGWESSARKPNGHIASNEKFPDMKALGDYLHQRGIRFGIYSSPGPLTCGRFLGSFEHERQDADEYARWGIDYLKYDLCSYEDHMSKDKTLEEFQKPYQLMGEALRSQTRDIIFSMCEYGKQDVWTWGAKMRGNVWRTSGDIEDTWESTATIGFAQDKMAPFAGPGYWNDPDMLVVGDVGWGGALHPSRLTPDEQYSHISLWSLLAAPLLLGNDLTSLDEFTRNLLTNDEVIAVDQDPLGHAARQVLNHDGWQVWARPLNDGRHAIGIFNLDAKFRELRIDPRETGLKDLWFKQLGLKVGSQLRDLWRQKDLGTLGEDFVARVPAHGVLLLSVD